MTDTDFHDRDDLVRQRHALAEFGRVALYCEELNDILQRACELVSHGCGDVKSKVLELMPRENSLLVRAGVGWKPGFVGSARLDADTGSAAGFALKTGAPVACPDVQNEDRFHISEVLKNQNVHSLVNVLIELPDGEAFGVLEVDSEAPREFDDDDIAFLRTYAHLLGAAIDRHRRTDQLNDAVRQKDLLMRELQHRVKNDLQMVNSLISMQARRAEPACADMLSSIHDRIETVRQLNEKLYQSAAIDRLELSSYLSDLARRLVDGHSDQGLELILDVQEMAVRADRAVPLGLITNEFLTNSMKYAFDGGAGAITLRLARADDGTAELTLADNGKGFSPDAPGGGTGLRLIGLLVKQLKADHRWTDGEGGAGLTVRFDLQIR